jgi:hypothetical protein
MPARVPHGPGQLSGVNTMGGACLIDAPLGVRRLALGARTHSEMHCKGVLWLLDRAADAVQRVTMTNAASHDAVAEAAGIDSQRG